MLGVGPLGSRREPLIGGTPKDKCRRPVVGREIEPASESLSLWISLFRWSVDSRSRDRVIRPGKG
jgi:hypothetical protein